MGRQRSGLSNLLHAASVLAVLLAVWQAAKWFFALPNFLLPGPADVAGVIYHQFPHIAFNALITIQEMLLGLLAGGLLGICVAVVLASFPVLDRYLMPVVVTTQTLPVFAIAPILVIWFGLGLGSKIVMAALIIFFPVASSLYDGLKQTPLAWLDLGHSWGASRTQLFRHMRLPAALPALMSGLKVAATLAPIGAVVGEWAGAAGGLGFVMLQANARTQMDVVFAALIVLAFCAWLLRFAVVKLSDRLTGWAHHTHG
ncbi:MAG: ABC transporter permease [Nitratireductor sp.]|nr:ABC transporter permease [Nitratireductor sp.]